MTQLLVLPLSVLALGLVLVAVAVNGALHEAERLGHAARHLAELRPALAGVRGEARQVIVSVERLSGRRER